MSRSKNEQEPIRQQKKSKFRWMWWLFLAFGAVVVLAIIAGGIYGTMEYRRLAQGLPELGELENFESSLVTEVYDRHGELIANFFTEKRILIDLEDVPKFIQNAIIAVEDKRFYAHKGIDPRGVLRAAWANWQAGEVVEGASTITMQVARTLFLTRERALDRKLREMILAWRIEQHFSKDEILRMYLNQVFFGHNAYGIEAASQIYYDKSVKDLTLGEGTLIAGMMQAPNNYSPIRNLSRFRITERSLEQLRAEEVPPPVLENLRSLMHFRVTRSSLRNLKTEDVPNEVLEKLGRIKDKKYTGKERLVRALQTALGEVLAAQYNTLILKYVSQDVMEEVTFLKALETTLGEAQTDQYKPLILKYSNLLDVSLARRRHVVRRMLKEGYITPDEARRAVEEPIQVNANYRSINRSPYFVEHVRRYLQDTYTGYFEVNYRSMNRLQAAGVPFRVLERLKPLLNQRYDTEKDFLSIVTAKIGEPKTKKAKALIASILKHASYTMADLYQNGWKIYTTLDMHLQRLAERAVHRGVKEVDKRYGYQKPFRRLAITGNDAVDRPLIEQVTLPPDTDPVVRVGEVLDGVVSIVDESAVWVWVKGSRGVMSPDVGFPWVREPDLERKFEKRRRLSAEEIFEVGDKIRVRVVGVDERNQAHQLVLEQEPLVEGALVAMEPESGHIVAMVGGYDDNNQFNRATQANRQPGSAFKPFVYTEALRAGKTPASVIYDRAMVIDGGDDETWKPQNYSQRYYGATTLRTALAKSRNMVTVRLMEDVGIDAVRNLARDMGIESALKRVKSLALGAGEVNLLEMTSAYGTLANSGLAVPPVFITRIVDPHQNLVEETLPHAKRAVSAEIAYVMTSLLQGVIEEGTARRVLALGRPAAGKTGTTDDFGDAWFLGYTPELVTGVWVGFDAGRLTLGYNETGGRAASPIWLEFMRNALRGRPITDFPIPPGVRFYRIDAESGREVNGPTAANKTRFEVFLNGTAPEPPASPTKNIREELHLIDQQRNATRLSQELERIKQQ